MSAKQSGPTNKKPSSTIDAKTAKTAKTPATAPKNQRQAAQSRPAARTAPIPFDTLSYRVNHRMNKFRGTTPPNNGTDAYAGAALAVYLLDRINLLLESKGQTEREVVPDFVKKFTTRYVQEMKPLEPVGNLSLDGKPALPGDFTPPELGVKESGDDTPPDLLGWLLLAIARPKIEITTPVSGTGNEDEDDDDDDDSGSGRGGSGSSGTGSGS